MLFPTSAKVKQRSPVGEPPRPPTPKWHLQLPPMERAVLKRMHLRRNARLHRNRLQLLALQQLRSRRRQSRIGPPLHQPRLVRRHRRRLLPRLRLRQAQAPSVRVRGLSCQAPRVRVQSRQALRSSLRVLSPPRPREQAPAFLALVGMIARVLAETTAVVVARRESVGQSIRKPYRRASPRQ